MQNIKTMIVLVAVFALFLGAVAGYYFGDKAGVVAGRAELLDEQAKAEAAKLSEIQKAANPFSGASDAANPFKGSYTNPFAQ